MMKNLLLKVFNPLLLFAFFLIVGLLSLFVMVFMRMQIDGLQINKSYSLPLSLPKANPQIYEKRKVVHKLVAGMDYVLPHYLYQIQLGDNLDNIFRKLGVSYQDKKKLIASDKKKKRLQNLKVGDALKFWLNDSGKLTKLEIVFNPELKTEYTKKGDKKFQFRETKAEGKWQQKIISGKIVGNFSLSAFEAGLSFKEIDEITKLLDHRVNLNRDLRVGDKFSVIRSVHIHNGKETGKSEIEAVKLHTGERVYSAYLYIDGHYYDEKGLPISRTFLRYPTQKKHAVSSHYNLERKHPISKKSMPHKGTDFYANTGTKVLATADGIVKVARYHPKAGYYLVIEHGHQYLTRYLHNSKILVKPGVEVKRGQIVAVSGKSGKVTGPHIHYELWAKGKPVDAMKAIIPSHTSVPKFQRPLYRKLVKKYDKLMSLAKDKGVVEGGIENNYRGNRLAMKESKD